MIAVTRWAGKHPLFVRTVLLPILFYMQGRLAFTAGARLFFDGMSLSDYWVWVMAAVIWIVTVIYPANARTILHTAYWRIKGLEWIACTAAFGLWLYAGNQLARTSEAVPVSVQLVTPVTASGLAFSESHSDVTTPETDAKRDHKLKRAYRNYFRNAIKQIKDSHRSQKIPLGLGIFLGVIGIGLGIVFLVCGIQCSSTGGGVALGVIGGLAFIGLGVWALVAGLRRTSSTSAK